MITVTRLITSLGLIALLTSSATADKFGQIQSALSGQPQQIQRGTPMQPHIQRIPQQNVGNIHNRALENNKRHSQVQNVPHQHGQGHHMRNDGFHVEFNNQHGRGHFERFHQFYYPWGAYPYTYYNQSAPSDEDTTEDQAVQEEQTQTPHAVQPKIIKILPDGTIINPGAPSSDADKDKANDGQY